jgi:hypothetical protein
VTAPFPRKRARVLRRRLTLPDRVIQAFKGKPFLNLAELADAFGYSPRTMRRHCNLGTINFHVRGVGTTSRHRAFYLWDAEEFWNRTERMELDALNVRRRGRARRP